MVSIHKAIEARRAQFPDGEPGAANAVEKLGKATLESLSFRAELDPIGALTRASLHGAEPFTSVAEFYRQQKEMAEIVNPTSAAALAASMFGVEGTVRGAFEQFENERRARESIIGYVEVAACAMRHEEPEPLPDRAFTRAPESSPIERKMDEQIALQRQANSHTKEIADLLSMLLTELRARPH